MSLMSSQSQVVRSLEACLEQIQRARAFRRAFMDASNSLPQDSPLLPALLDAVGLFNELRIPYALIGGIAAMVYGRARFTDDVDFVASANHQKVFGENPDVMRRYNFDAASTWKLYHASGIEIDIWKDEHTDGIAARAREVQLEKYIVRVADVHDLIAMKLRAGRLQDDYDIGEIVRSAGFDEAKLRQLVSADQFERFKQIRIRAERQ